MQDQSKLISNSQGCIIKHKTISKKSRTSTNKVYQKQARGKVGRTLWVKFPLTKERSSKSSIRHKASRVQLPADPKEVYLQSQLSHLPNTTSQISIMFNTSRKRKRRILLFKIRISKPFTILAIDSNTTVYVKIMHGRTEVIKLRRSWHLAHRRNLYNHIHKTNRSKMLSIEA